MHPVAVFLGGLILTSLVYGFARPGDLAQIATMPLLGISVNTLLGAGISLTLSFLKDEQSSDIVFWLLGSLAGALWELPDSAGPLILFAIIALVLQAGALNLLTLGDAEARYLSVLVQRTQLLIVPAPATELVWQSQ